MIFGGDRPARGVSHEKKRVLVVCGEPRVLAEIKMGLMHCFEVSIAATGDAAIAVLNAHGVDAIVIYIDREREKALSVFACVSACVGEGGAPILFLAEHDDERDESAAFEMGAADYAVRRSGGSDALIARLSLRVGEGERRSESGSAPDASGASPEALLAGKTILIAEDIALNQEIITVMLSEIEGLTLEFASNGLEAVALFKKNAELYSLIFMDIYMPEMDGLSAARAIRRLDCKRAQEIPILALTANTAKDEIKEFLEAGMDGYLEKPIEYEKFLRTCAQYLS